MVPARVSIALVGLLFAAPAAQADVSFEPVPLGTTPDVQEIVLTNDGDDTFATGVPAITGTDASAFTFAYDYCVNDTLDPGEDCELAVEFDPLRMGLNGATLEVPIVGEPEPFRLALSGEGKPSVSVTPTRYDFGISYSSLAKGSSVAVTVRNVTDEELSGLRTSFSPSLRRGFDVTARTCGATLAPGATCAYTVSFTGHLVGTYADALNVIAGSRTLASVPLTATHSRRPAAPPTLRPAQPRTPTALVALSTRLSAAVKRWKHADRAHLRRGFVVSGLVPPADGKLELTVVGGRVVARGSLAVSAGKPARLQLRPTPAGRRLLRLDRALRLRVVLRFVPSAGGRGLRIAAELPLRANSKH